MCGGFATKSPEKLKQSCEGLCSPAGRQAIRRGTAGKNPNHAIKHKISLFVPLYASLTNNEDLRSSIAALARTRPTFTRSVKVVPKSFVQQLHAQSQDQGLQSSSSAAQQKIHALRARDWWHDLDRIKKL